MWSAPAKADPPAAALFGSINGRNVAIYAQNSAFGICLELDTQNSAGAWYNFRNIECGIDQGKLDAKGGAAGYITYLLPDINGALATQFGGSSNDPAALVIQQVDTALSTAFKFSGAAVVPR